MPERQTCHFRASGLKKIPKEVPGPPTLDEALRPDHSRTASYGPEKVIIIYYSDSPLYSKTKFKQ